MLALILALMLSSERIEIRDSKLSAPGQNRCVRLRADGSFERARVRINDVSAGELADQKSELDITGYLSPGAANTVEVRAPQGTVEHVWALASPLVYVASARLIRQGELEVTIVNSTENTAQVEIGENQFTVSPGTTVTKQLRWTGGSRLRMRAVSDGLDREFIDEADIVEHQ